MSPRPAGPESSPTSTTTATGTRDAGEPFKATDADGYYLIPSVTAGTHSVRIEVPAGLTCTTAGCARTATVSGALNSTANDFGLYAPPAPPAASGTVWSDTDADGVRDAAEIAGISGIRVWVDTDDDGVLDAGEPTSLTDAAGDYTITAIAPGTAKVRVAPGSGSHGARTCSSPVPCSYTRSFTAGVTSTGNDFGLYAPAQATISSSPPSAGVHQKRLAR